ncbi:hypothetical protein HETIRDRAFT_326023 [Heterobasidion irregulare TC 32-1]|uniref:Uncharacterized protein n=1 Tax=Heterobasidion irregulare (strain TC 32-1) TaxID=747525 RepID=W4JXW9_HETIT|nr:uncharacterized protein HETIRDRAFT_326023 [Heterobasidion irregulare TC 32-1]ETW78378.1 hypothetical protein HETIRDRAFT_326023 [Heterobasidion irregulare TC 32-1]
MEICEAPALKETDVEYLNPHQVHGHLQWARPISLKLFPSCIRRQRLVLQWSPTRQSSPLYLKALDELNSFTSWIPFDQSYGSTLTMSVLPNDEIFRCRTSTSTGLSQFLVNNVV